MKNDNKSYLEFNNHPDYLHLMEYINELSERYPFITVSFLGESILSRGIPMITLGMGDKSVMYIGAHGGSESITSVLLMRFVKEYSELYSEKKSIFTYDLEYLFSTRSIAVIPMLNPDGVDYNINGLKNDNPLYERVVKMNGGGSDLSLWNANARGVELSRNYNYAFSDRKRRELEADISDACGRGFSGNMPLSEPEVAALCTYLRFNENVAAVLSLYTDGELIRKSRYSDDSERLANAIKGVCGYKIKDDEGEGFCDWCATALERPAFEIMCGKEERKGTAIDDFKIYADIRKLLFLMPTFV